MPNEDKETLIEWFGQMRDFEKSAKDTYLSIASDPRVEDEEIRKVFETVANDESRHVDIVQRIINIVQNNL
jgi:rubrerythrin